MTTLTHTVRLRALESGDLDLVHSWENSEEIWKVSDTRMPLSRDVVERHMLQSTNIYAAGQLRLGIECDGTLEGIVDIYDCDFYHMYAHVGLYVTTGRRCNGLGATALDHLAQYASTHLRMRNLFAEVSADNAAAQRVFETAGYQKVGVRQASHYTGETYVDEIQFQKTLV